MICLTGIICNTFYVSDIICKTSDCNVEATHVVDVILLNLFLYNFVVRVDRWKLNDLVTHVAIDQEMT